MSATLPAYMILANEACDLDNEVALYKIMAFEGTTMSNIKAAIKKYWRKFIDWLMKWLSNIGRIITGIPRFLSSIWNSVRDRHTKIKGSQESANKVITILGKLARRCMSLFKTVDNAYEEGYNSEDDTDFDSFYERTSQAIDNLSDEIAKLSNVSNDKDLNNIAMFAFEAYNNAPNDDNGMTVDEFRNSTNDYLRNLTDTLNSAKHSQESVRREAQVTSKTVDDDEPEDQTGHQKFLSRICALFSKISAAIVAGIKACGRLIMNIITGRGFTTAADNEVKDSGIGQYEYDAGDFTFDIGGVG